MSTPGLHSHTRVWDIHARTAGQMVLALRGLPVNEEGEGIQGQVGVSYVVLERALDLQWGITDACTAKHHTTREIIRMA